MRRLMMAALLILSLWLPSVPVAAAATPKMLPIYICLGLPSLQTQNGQAVLNCPKPVANVPAHRQFYLAFGVTSAQGFQTYGLDWGLAHWQVKGQRWSTMRSAKGARIQPDWQYAWIRESGLTPGRYVAWVASDFPAKLVGAPVYHFAVAFQVH